jgi:TRAP-type C4-dicarboxylate transport system permease small subunit
MKKVPKGEYLGFAFAIFLSALGMAIVIGLYISMIQTPGGLGLQIIRLSLPIISFAILFFTLRIKYRKIKAYGREE